MAFIALIEILLWSESLNSNFASLRVINFLSSYFRYLSKEITPKVLGFDFKRDFQSNFKTKLKENNLNTQWKWWTVCMPRLKRLIVPHSVKVKICIKYRKDWKSYMSFQLSGQTRPFLAVLKISAIFIKYPTCFWECFLHDLMGNQSTKLKFLLIEGSALKSLSTLKWEKV